MRRVPKIADVPLGGVWLGHGTHPCLEVWCFELRRLGLGRLERGRLPHGRRRAALCDWACDWVCACAPHQLPLRKLLERHVSPATCPTTTALQHLGGSSAVRSSARSLRPLIQQPLELRSIPSPRLDPFIPAPHLSSLAPFRCPSAAVPIQSRGSIPGWNGAAPSWSRPPGRRLVRPANASTQPQPRSPWTPAVSSASAQGAYSLNRPTPLRPLSDKRRGIEPRTGAPFPTSSEHKHGRSPPRSSRKDCPRNCFRLPRPAALRSGPFVRMNQLLAHAPSGRPPVRHALSRSSCPWRGSPCPRTPPCR